MLFQMMNTSDGRVVLVHADQLKTYLNLGYAFFVSPGK